MYNLSQFNNYFESSNNFLLISNSLSSSLIRIPECNKKLFFDKISNIDNVSKESINELESFGIIVPDFYNEEAIANVRILDTISENVLTLLIVPVFDCDFDCSYCYESFFDKRMDYSIIDNIEKYLIKNLKDKKQLNICWFGGEPLLAFDIISYAMKKFYNICKKYKIIFNQSIITNGYNLTSEKIESLIKYNCSHIQVTLDGDRNIHNKYRYLKNKGKTFDQIISNLKYIRDNVKSRFLTVTIRVNVTKDIFQNIENFISLLENEFNESKYFRVMWRYVEDWGGEKVKQIQNKLGNLNLMRKIFSLLKNKKLNINAHTRIFNCGMTVCGAIKKNFYIIGPDSNIFKCTLKMYKDELCNIGYLDDNGIMVLNNAKEAMWRYVEISKNCKSCKFYPSCMGANCPAQRLFYARNSCPYDKHIIKEIVEIITKNNNKICKEVKL